jgi:transcriptional regulator with XRE-family HTH domain
VSPVKVITVSPVDPDTLEIAITGFVRDWVRKRNAAGESQKEIAASLGFNSHATVAQYINPNHPVKVTAKAQRYARQILFDGDNAKFEQAAMDWFNANRTSQPAPDLPLAYVKAAGFLEATHGRDFTAAAQAHLQFAHHKAEGMTIKELADQIYELAQEAKGKAVPNHASQEFEEAKTGRSALGKGSRK